MKVVYETVRRFSMSLRRPSPDYWREAATLIVAAPIRPSSNTLDNLAHLTTNREPFNMLMLKRGSKSPFMPDGYVYPGGCVTDDDFDRDSWTAVFDRVTNLGMELIETSLQIPGPQVDMLQSNKRWTSSLLPDVAFRICALRETFEESGLLFVTHKDSFSSRDANSYSCAFPRRIVPKMHKMPDHFDATTWRKRVSADSSSFRTLCEEFDVVPNIWALFNWTNWLTPVTKRLDKPPTKPKRYDTMFYVCCLERQPDGTEACTDETTEAEWKTPMEWLDEHLSQRIKMFGPQIYETERLSVLPSLGELAEYTQQREPLGLVRFLPVIVVCQDGVVLVLPGDEEYPDDPDTVGSKMPIVSPLTAQRFMSSGVRCHRALIDERGYRCTIELPYGLFTNPAGSTYHNQIGTDPKLALARAIKPKL